MPPRRNLNKYVSKEKNPSIKKKETEITSTLTESTLSPELTQQFELELCWCIQQLQIALKSGKLNEKQAKDNKKALITLMNNSTPIIKKRQLMRLSFGDYREKMAAEANKNKNVSAQVKITSAAPSKKSVFIKKATFSKGCPGFQFNFQLDTFNEACVEEKKNNLEESKISNCLEDGTAKNVSEEITDTLSKTVTQEDNNKRTFKFVPSNNSFRFNFS